MVAHASELHGQELHHAEGHGGGPKRSVWLRGSWVRAFWVSAVMGLAAAGGNRFAWFPDGRSFAYVGSGGSAGTRLWIRSLDALDATPIAGTDGAVCPFTSPDGTQVGFVTRAPFTLRTAPARPPYALLLAA